MGYKIHFQYLFVSNELHPSVHCNYESLMTATLVQLVEFKF